MFPFYSIPVYYQYYYYNYNDGILYVLLITLLTYFPQANNLPTSVMNTEQSIPHLISLTVSSILVPGLRTVISVGFKLTILKT